MKKGLVKSLIFLAGLILLIIDLATYYTQIILYFTTLGQVLLLVSIILLIISFFIKSKR